MGCWGAPPHYGVSTHSISVLSGVCSKLPLPRHAEVQLHIPMTHNTDVGRSGFIRKPPLDQDVAVAFGMVVLGTMHLGGGNTKPLVDIQIYGADGDSHHFKTPPFKRDKADAVWTEKNKFHLDNINQPRHALVHISAIASSNGQSLGWACLPMSSIRPGFRAVPLEGAPTPLAHVFIRFDIGPLKQHAGTTDVVMAGEMEKRPIGKS